MTARWSVIHVEWPMLMLSVALLLVPACDALQDEAETSASKEATTPGEGLDFSSAIHVDFASGTTALVVEGHLAAGEKAQYLLGAHEGDYLFAHAITPGEDIDVSVHRLDDETEIPRKNEVGSYWTGRLPASCGYLITLHGASEGTPFALEAEIPRHLPLAPEQESVEIQSTILPHVPVAYLLPAEVGKNVTVSVSSADDTVKLAIHGVANGQPLVGWDTETHSYTGTFPDSQDYVIRLIPGSEPSEFTLKVEVG